MPIFAADGRTIFTGDNRAALFLPKTAHVEVAWPAANRAIFVPFRINAPITVYYMWTINAFTANGNVDVGIYAPDGTRIDSTGAVASAGFYSMQRFTMNNKVLGPGQYYMAMSRSSGTNTSFAFTPSQIPQLRILGALQMAAAHPLPAAATFATMTSAHLPTIGIGTRPSVM